MSLHILMHDFADDQRSILLLAGTGDGPRLAKLLQQRGWTVSVSVVTEAAARTYGDLGVNGIRIGALGDESGIAALLQQQGPFRWVVDATHPFAVRISRDLNMACRRVRQPLLRFERSVEPIGKAILFQEAGELRLAELQGQRLLLAIGGRQLAAISSIARAGGAELFARCLPSRDGIKAALAAGLLPDRLAVLRPLQGPVPGAIERALCRQWGITAVLCRQSGGVSERLWHRLSEELQLNLLLLQRPEPSPEVELVEDDAALLDRIGDG